MVTQHDASVLLCRNSNFDVAVPAVTCLSLVYDPFQQKSLQLEDRLLP